MYKVDSPIIFKQYVFQCSSVFIPNIYVYNCRLGKKLPTHTMSNYCSKLEIQDDDDDDDDRYEDIIQEYDDCSYSPELSQSYIAESKARTAMKENQEEELRKISQLPPPKSFLQKTPGLKPDVPNCSFPPDTRRFRDHLSFILKNKKGLLPNNPVQSDEYDNKHPDIEAKQVMPTIPISQRKNLLDSEKKLRLPPKPPDSNCAEGDLKTEFGKNSFESPLSPKKDPPTKHNGQSFEQSTDNQSSDSKKKKDRNETVKGSCFDSSENILKDRDGTKKEYATDRKNLVDKESSLSRESKSANKTNLNQRAKPFYVNDQELKADDTSNPLYVNQNQPETKPALPPRKPFNKK